jgi:hypothetical protein
MSRCFLHEYLEQFTETIHCVFGYAFEGCALPTSDKWHICCHDSHKLNVRF